VLLNAGAAIFLASRTKSLREGAALAADSIDSMEAMKKLEALKVLSTR
jgi:anthranilate phosphoribosyltransferase/anthranilate synthase/phosphoribosyltransferase